METKKQYLYNLVIYNSSAYVLMIDDNKSGELRLPTLISSTYPVDEGEVIDYLNELGRFHVEELEVPSSGPAYSESDRYVFVLLRDPMITLYATGFWADPVHIAEEEHYPGLLAGLKKRKMDVSTTLLYTRSYSKIEVPAYRRGMEGGFDYRKVFSNPEKTPEDRELFMQGWRDARKMMLERDATRPFEF